MKIIVVQGMPCLGKSTLCKQLQDTLQECKVFCLDNYKEYLWDKYGFDSIEQRNYLTEWAKEIFLNDVQEVVIDRRYKYLLLDYVFKNDLGAKLLYCLKERDVSINTLYLEASDLHEHEKAWKARSRNFSIRHPGHGASYYCNGKGSGYSNNFTEKIDMNLPEFGDTLRISVQHNPYFMSMPIESILDFIKSN